MSKNLSYRHVFSFWIPSILAGLFILFASSVAEGQNTKGDRPVPNQQVVRQTKAKSIKKKERGKTRDIAGRKLRTKNKSSVSRANSSFPQPNPYSKRKNIKSDKPAETRGPVYSTTPRTRERAWQGDISGRPIKRVPPRTTEYARHNVYPQSGPYVNHTSSRKVSGKDVAWKGDLKGKKFQARKPTQYKKPNYPQSGRAVNYISRESSYVGQSLSNKREVNRVSRLSKSSHQESSGRKRTITPRSGSKPYVTNRKKNVYWGKFTKSGKVITTDIAGRPLRTRNFQSAPIGLVEPTFNPYYGRKNISDRPHSGRGTTAGFEPSKRGQRAWSGDISGRKIRRNVTKHDPEKLTKPLLPYKKTLSRKGEQVGQPIRGSGFKSVSRKNKGKGLPIGVRTGGPGSQRVGTYQGNFKKGELSPGFSPQGVAYSGNMKSNRPLKGGGSVSGATWNNKGMPIPVRTGGPNASRAASFQGNFRKGELSPGFSPQGVGYAGNMKSRRPLKGGGSISGKLWNNSGAPIPVRTGISNDGATFRGTYKRGELSPGFSLQGANFAGNLKTKKPLKGGGSVSGKLWNNDGTPIPVRTGVSNDGATFQGNYKRGELSPGFSLQGANFAGNLKTKKPLKGGGSVSGRLWNNDGTPIPVRTGVSNDGAIYQGNFKRGQLSPGFSEQGASFSGNIKRSSLSTFSPQGANYAGNLKARKPQVGGGSVSGKLWNNNGTPISVRTGVSNDGATYQGKYKRGQLSPGFSEQGANYSGNIKRSSLSTFSPQGANYAGNLKAKRPQVGGGSVSGKLWNNNESPIASGGIGSTTTKIAAYSGTIKRGKSSFSPQGGDFSGNIKSKKPVTGGGSVSGLLWNNKERALDLQTAPQKNDLRMSVHTDKKRKSFLEQSYIQNPNASSLSLKKEKPESTKAGEYNRTMKMYWSLKHNPNSADGALRVNAPSKASARITDYQGNVKMRKYTSKNLHPDAKFAHLEENNVKEERTILTTIKLFWSNLFKKNDTQPDHLKEKDRKPRYDKGEKDLWYY